MVIGGIILIIALLAGTYFAAGDAFNGDDYINSLTMLGAVAIITITVFVALKYYNQMKNDKAGGELSEERWDEDVIIASYTLKELKDSSAGWLSHKYCKWLIYKGCLKFLFKINKGGNK
jgi:hypothetical protein